LIYHETSNSINMPDLRTSIVHLADLELYKTEKPYLVINSINDRDDDVATDNLAFETYEDIVVRDVRGLVGGFSLESSGFAFMQHASSLLRIETWTDIRSYQKETEEFLTRHFDAAAVYCYDLKIRKNRERLESEVHVKDLRDWTVPERPALAAHNDVTYDSGPQMIDFHLPPAMKEEYLKPGFRFRIVNTWRGLLPKIEDSPLAVCDYRSVDKNDLIACDRVIPTRAGEVYYLRYNPQQRWYFQDCMTPQDLLVMMMYDSADGTQARYCPHTPVDNPAASTDTPPRRSVETRSVIITKLHN